MNWIIFIAVAVCSIILAIAVELFFYILPSWKSLKEENSKALLAKSMVYLNKNTLLNGTITAGQHLHDITYKSFVLFLCEKPKLKFRMMRDIRYTEENEEARLKFREEVNLLDKNTRENISMALDASSKILFLSNPFLSLLLSYKFFISRERFMAEIRQSTEYYILKRNKELNECYNH